MGILQRSLQSRCCPEGQGPGRGYGDSQHGHLLHSLSGSLDHIVGEYEIALNCLRLYRERSAWHDQVVHFSFIKVGAFLLERDERKREPSDMIAVLEKAPQVVEAGDFRWQNKRFCLPIKREIFPARDPS